MLELQPIVVEALRALFEKGGNNGDDKCCAEHGDGGVFFGAGKVDTAGCIA